MIDLGLPDGTLSALCLGAHPDDIEIGCGGTLLAWGESGRLQVTTAIMTGRPDRQEEARRAVELFLGDASQEIVIRSMPDGRLPTVWGEVKESLEELASRCHPDVVLAPRQDDAHQDHRLVGALVTTVWRDALVLRYEIPKWDGDLGRPTHYVPLTADQAHRKVELLNLAYPSQHARDWWNPETFLGLMRLRGIECRADYAEAFETEKVRLRLAPQDPEAGRG